MFLMGIEVWDKEMNVCLKVELSKRAALAGYAINEIRHLNTSSHT